MGMVSNVSFESQPNNTVSCWMVIVNQMMNHYFGQMPYSWQDMSTNMETEDPLRKTEDMLRECGKNLTAYTVDLTLENIKKEIDQDNPVIMVVKYKNSDDYHSVLVAGYTSDNKLVIFDPESDGPKHCSYTGGEDITIGRRKFTIYSLSVFDEME